jgi:hypothetical protein
LGGEVELAGLTDAAHLDVGGGVGAGGDGFVRDVGDGAEDVAQGGVELVDVVFEGFYVLADGAALLDQIGGVVALALGLGHLGADRIAPRFEALDFGDGGAAAGVDLGETVEAVNRAAGFEAGADGIEIFAQMG